jgi:hypothetical protein
MVFLLIYIRSEGKRISVFGQGPPRVNHFLRSVNVVVPTFYTHGIDLSYPHNIANGDRKFWDIAHSFLLIYIRSDP